MHGTLYPIESLPPLTHGTTGPPLSLALSYNSILPGNKESALNFYEITFLKFYPQMSISGCLCIVFSSHVFSTHCLL